LSTDSFLAPVVIWATVVIELSVVPLLVWKRTRWLGVLVGSLFHGVISLDFSQHFYDFTAVLFFLFAAFLKLDHEPSPDPFSGRVTKFLAAPISLLMVGLSVTTPSEASSQLLRVVPFILWIPFLLWWLYFVWRRREPAAVQWKVPPVVAAVVAVAFVNGLTPYFEVKTGYSFNMYSNLVTAQGESNHFLLQSTLPLRDGYEGPVDIIESSDPGLELYRDRGYVIAFPQFQRYLAGRSLSVTYSRNGSVTSVADKAEVDGLASLGPWWWRWMPLRSLDLQSPPRCQDVFLPAL
jgi:hypothetical protein